MKWEPVFSEIKIRGFNPRTSSKKKIERKENLKKEIKAKIGKDLQKIQNRCKDRPLFIDVCFSLHDSGVLGSAKKDLDNLMKILLDVLSVNMINGQKPIEGLGIVRDDSDIRKITCKKETVNSPECAGLDLQISTGH